MRNEIPIYRQLLDALGPTTERQPTEQQLAAQPPVAKTVRGSQRSVASAEPRRQRPLDETRPRKSATGEVDERVVRVTAKSLTRLMGLAGESLVEARWLHPFAQSLLKLKKQQSLVAHMLDELRLSLPPDPLQHSIRLTELLGEAVEEGRHLLADRIEAFENHARRSDDLNSRLYHEVIASRMRPFNDGVQTFPRMVRDLARQLGKQVHFEIRGRTTEVDRDILDKLEAPLTHILRNARSITVWSFPTSGWPRARVKPVHCCSMLGTVPACSTSASPTTVEVSTSRACGKRSLSVVWRRLKWPAA